MATTAPHLLEVVGAVRLDMGGGDVPQLDRLDFTMQVATNRMEVLTLPGNTVRKQLAMTVGANLIHLRASQPVKVFYGTSIEGHDTDVLLAHGSFPQGILVTTYGQTELRLLVAKEAV